MKRLDISVFPPAPSIQQVLWRAGCPPESAGENIRQQAAASIETLKTLFTDSWCGAILFDSGERPEFLKNIWPDMPLAVMAVTLGMPFQRFTEQSGELERFMLDSAGSVSVESFMKRVQFTLTDTLNMQPTKRIAPGYGALPLSWQKEIIDMFPLSGITCSDAYMLFPVKSMTGVVGWIRQEN